MGFFSTYQLFAQNHLAQNNRQNDEREAHHARHITRGTPREAQNHLAENYMHNYLLDMQT
jgi:hypothetical protein